MSDSSNPFIGNPFAKRGTGSAEAEPDPPAPPPRHRDSSSVAARPSTAQNQALPNTLAAPLAQRHRSVSQNGLSAKRQPAERLAHPDQFAAPEPAAPRPAPSTQTRSPSGAAPARKKSRSTARSKSSPAPTAAQPQRSSGYKVQIIAKLPVSNNTNLPSRDALWFAVYPIIPRVGDCLFRDGMYFRVDAVFLYEDTRPGWCADVEVSYYARQR